MSNTFRKLKLALLKPNLINYEIRHYTDKKSVVPTIRYKPRIVQGILEKGW